MFSMFLRTINHQTLISAPLGVIIYPDRAKFGVALRDAKAEIQNSAS